MLDRMCGYLINSSPINGGLLRGIGLRVLVYVLLFSSAVTLLLTALQLYLDYREDIRLLERRFVEIEEVFIPSLAESLWRLDRKQVDILLVGLLRMPDFEYVEIVETDPPSLSFSQGEHIAEQTITREISIRCDCGGNDDMVLGMLRIEVSLERIYAALFQRGLIILGSEGIKTFLVSFFLLYVFHMLVTRHLVGAANAMSRGEPIDLERGWRRHRDELDQLVAAYNALKTQHNTSLSKAEELARHNASLIENLPGSIVRLKYYPDGKKRILSIMGEGLREEVLAASPDELAEFFHPDDRESLFKTVWEMLRDTGYCEHRFRRKLPDGNYLWLLAREKVIERLEDGCFIAEALAIDINDQMNAQLAKERSERIFQDLVHALPVGVFVVDNDGNVKIYNEAAVSIWGRRPKLGEPYNINKSWTDPDGAPLSHNDDVKIDWLLGLDGAPLRVEEHPISMALNQNKALRNIELKFRHPDGRGVPTLSYPSPLRDVDGSIIGAFNVMVDVSELKKAETAHRTREREYRTLVENAPVLIVRYDKDLRRVFVNKAWEQLSGVSAVDVVGHPASGTQQLPLQTNDAYVHKLHEVLITGNPQTIEFDWTTPSGALMTFEYQIVQEVDEGGDVAGVLAIGRDLTGHKRLEEERLQLDAHMEATRTMQTLGQLASGIAHDFNNLLGAIMGYAQFIAEDAEPKSGIVNYSRRILAAGRHGKALVEQILAFSRHGDMETSVFPLAAVIREIRDILDVAIPSSTRIVLEIEDEYALIEGDREHIGQVVMNLAINAKDAYEGEPGDIVIAVRPPLLTKAVTQVLAAAEAVAPMTWTEADGTICTVHGGLKRDLPAIAMIVEDRGVGMDETVMQQMFTPFYTSKASHGGTGLGLAVIQGIVQTHGAAMVVQSRRGQGTKAKVIFPLAGVEKSSLDRRRVSPRSSSASLASIRVLLVDDDQDFGDMLTTALERKGAEVAACVSPREILDVLEEAPEPWHVLITDQTMPDMCGTDLIKQVKSMRPDLPCILCTGYAEGMGEEECVQAGADAMMRKPLDLERMVKTILDLSSAD